MVSHKIGSVIRSCAYQSVCVAQCITWGHFIRLCVCCLWVRKSASYVLSARVPVSSRFVSRYFACGVTASVGSLYCCVDATGSDDMLWQHAESCVCTQGALVVWKQADWCHSGVHRRTAETQVCDWICARVLA